jgi:GntR family transcriptional regulator
VTVDPQSGTPKYVQLADILRAAIQRGDYPPGRLLPSEKRLGQEHEISPLTARHAVGILRKEGLVKTVPGRGIMVVGPLDTQTPRHPDRWRGATALSSRFVDDRDLP